MKIKSVHIKNFQSHADTILELHPGVNAIIGLSDKGKSAVLRLLRWVAFNTPSSDGFISHWADVASGEITFENGLSVTRIKGKGINEYRAKTANGTSVSYSGFNQSVPEVVKEVLNLQDVNFRFQHQGAFFLSENSGEVSRYLNKIAKLEAIDTATSSLKTLHSEHKRIGEAERENVKRLSGDLKKYETLPQIEAQLIALEEEERGLRTSIDRYNALFDLHEAATALETQIKEPRRIAGARILWDQADRQDKKVDAIGESIGKLDVLTSQAKAWESGRVYSQKISQRAGEVKAAQDLLEQNVEGWKRFHTLVNIVEDFTTTQNRRNVHWKAVAFEDKVQEAIGINARVRALRLTRDMLERMSTAIKRSEQAIWQKEAEAKELHDEYDVNFPDVCPFCGKEK